MSKASEDEEFEMHYLVKERRNEEKQCTEFLVKWKGWAAKWNTWEPEENIRDLTFIANLRAKKKTTKKKTSPEAGNTPKKMTAQVNKCVAIANCFIGPFDRLVSL